MISKSFKLLITVCFCSLVLLVIPNLLQAQGQCAGFPDVDGDDNFCSAIEYAKKINVITGQSSGEFGYDQVLNRAEAAAVLVRYLDISLPTEFSEISKFKDVKKSEWYAPHFEILLKRGIFKGYPDGTLKPAGNLNKAEWITLWYRTLEFAGSKQEQSIKDVVKDKSTEWFRFYLNDAVSNGFITLNAGKFEPDKGQVRQLVADLIYRSKDASANPPILEGDSSGQGIDGSKLGLLAGNDELKNYADVMVGNQFSDAPNNATVVELSDNDSLTDVFSKSLSAMSKTNDLVVWDVNSLSASGRNRLLDGLITFAAYLDRFEQVQKIGDTYYQLKVLDFDMHVLWNQSIPANLKSGTVGVFANGVLLSDSDFQRDSLILPVIIWNN